MGKLTIRLPDDQHTRLKTLARDRGISLNTLLEELTTQAITESNATARFRVAATRGDARRGLATLERLDRHFGD